MDVPLWISIAVLASIATIVMSFVFVAVAGGWWERPVRVVVVVLAVLTAIAFGGIYKGGELQFASSVGMAIFGLLGVYHLGKFVR